MTKFAASLGVTGVAANPALLASLNNMQFPQNGMPSMGGAPDMGAMGMGMGMGTMDPNMAAAMYQQQMMAQQQNPQMQQLLELAQQSQALLEEREQMMSYLQQAEGVINQQAEQIYQLENPDALDPESVDRALCLSAAQGGSAWDNMRLRLRNTLDNNVGAIPIDQSKKLLDNVLQQFSQAGESPNGEDCGMGVLSLHLLNAMTMDDTERTARPLSTSSLSTRSSPLPSSPFCWIFLGNPFCAPTGPCSACWPRSTTASWTSWTSRN